MLAEASKREDALFRASLFTKRADQKTVATNVEKTWDTFTMTPYRALQEALKIRLNAEKLIIEEPSKRMDHSKIIEAIELWWLDHANEIFHEKKDQSLEDFLWITISFLACTDTKRSTAIAKGNKLLNEVEIEPAPLPKTPEEKLLPPLWAPETFIETVLVSELKFRTMTFHWNEMELFELIQTPIAERPPDPKAHSMAPATGIPEKPPPLPIRDPRDITKFGSVLKEMPLWSVLSVCSAFMAKNYRRKLFDDDPKKKKVPISVPTSTSVRDKEKEKEKEKKNKVDTRPLDGRQAIMSLCSRLYHCIKVNEWICKRYQSYSCNDIPEKEVDFNRLEETFQRWCVYQLENDARVGFRDFVSQRLGPANYTLNYLRLFGAQREDDKPYTKFQKAIPPLCSDQRCSSSFFNWLVDSTNAPVKTLIDQPDKFLGDAFRFFMFAFMFKATMRISFMDRYVRVNEQLQPSLEPIVATEVGATRMKDTVRPLIVFYAKSIRIRHNNMWVECKTAFQACMYWTWLVMKHYDGELEERGGNIKKMKFTFVNLMPPPPPPPPKKPIPAAAVSSVPRPVAARATSIPRRNNPDDVGDGDGDGDDDLNTDAKEPTVDPLSSSASYTRSKSIQSSSMRTDDDMEDADEPVPPTVAAKHHLLRLERNEARSLRRQTQARVRATVLAKQASKYGPNRRHPPSSSSER